MAAPFTCLMLLAVFAITPVLCVDIYSVTPQSGSVAGNTQITIAGEGFEMDMYDGSNVVRVGDILCDVVWFYTTPNQIVCNTRSVQDLSSSYIDQPLSISVVVNNVDSASCSDPSCQYTYATSATITVQSIDPQFAPVDTNITLYLDNLDISDIGDVERVFVGSNDVCDLYDGKSPVGYTDDSVSCISRADTANIYNVTLSVPSSGNSSARGVAQQVDVHGRLYSFQVYPEITAVTPTMGSLFGGTFVTITGTGFGSLADSVQVAVSVGTIDVPCTVLDVSSTEITCITAAPPNPAQLPLNIGSRGVMVELWEGIGGQSVASLTSNPRFINEQPNVTYVGINAEWPSGSLDDYFGARLTGFITFPFTGSYSLWITSDDDSELWFNANGTLVKVAANMGAKGASSFDNSYQRSPIYQLVAGQHYQFEALFKENAGLEMMNIAAFFYNSTFVAAQTGSARSEQQTLTFTTALTKEIQTISVLASDLQPFTLSWSGRESLPLTANSSAADVQAAVSSLTVNTCSVNTNNGALFNLATFEQASSLWTPRDGSTPVQDLTDSFCGMASMRMPLTPFGRNFEGTSGFKTADFPFICSAFKLPPGAHVGILVYVQDVVINDWRLIKVTNESADANYAYPVVADFNSVAQTILTNNTWQYVCINLNLQLQDALGYDPNRIITSMIFYQPVWGVPLTGFWVDEFSIASKARVVTRTGLSVRPGGVQIQNVTVTRTVDNAGMVNFDLLITPMPNVCPVSLPNLAVVNNASSALVFKTRPLNAPLGGQVGLSLNGYPPVFISPTANLTSIAQALSGAPGFGSSVAVSLASSPNADVCLGRSLRLRFDGLGGNVPLLSVVNNLTGGVNASVHVARTVTGGLLVNPIPNDWLSLPSSHSVVRLQVNGVPSHCPDDDLSACAFTFDSSVSPLLNGISPSQGAGGSMLTITGSSFGATNDLNEVDLGDTSCELTFSSVSELHCVVPDDAIAGLYPVHVHVEPFGQAGGNSAVQFTVLMHLENVTYDNQMSGISVNGGVSLTIFGRGFSGVACETLVDLALTSNPNAHIACPIVFASESILVCTAPAMPTAGFATVHVHVNSSHSLASVSDSLLSAVQYSDSSTPALTLISPASGSGFGGDVLTLTGSNFWALGTESECIGDATGASCVTVVIDDAPCIVSSSTNTQIVCVTSAHADGVYSVDIQVNGLGLSKADAGSQFEYHLRVTDMSPAEGSLRGGQFVTIDTDFGNHNIVPSEISVTLGGRPCSVTNATHAGLVCETSSSQHTYSVSNNLVPNPLYGLGYMWSPSSLVISVGDTVAWSWVGDAFSGPLHNVQQVASDVSNVYDGSGFSSGTPTRIGAFNYTFVQPGTYFYVSNIFGSRGMRGSITVKSVEQSSVSAQLQISLTSRPEITFAVDLAANAILLSTSFCAENWEQPVLGDAVVYYSYAGCATPRVDSVTPNSGINQTPLSLHGDHFGSSAAHLTVQVGGALCHISDLAETVVNCSTNAASPVGALTFQLYSSQLGYGIADNVHFYQVPAIFEISPRASSHAGGLLINISGSGFDSIVLSNNVVIIGNTPCTVVSATYSSITCLNNHAQDDGYSSLILRNAPLAYYPFDQLPDDYSIINLGSLDNVDGVFIGTHLNLNVEGIFPNVTIQALAHEYVGSHAVLLRGDVAEIPFHPRLNRNDTFTVELWARFAAASLPSQYQVIVDSAASGSGYAIVLNACGQVEVWLAADSQGPNTTCASDGTSCQVCAEQLRLVDSSFAIGRSSFPLGLFTTLQSSVLIADSAWHHVAFSVAAGVASLFVDGTLNVSVELSNAYVPLDSSNGQALRFGGDNGDIELDEFALYATVLTEQELSDHAFFGLHQTQLVRVAVKSISGLCHDDTFRCGFKYAEDLTAVIYSVTPNTNLINGDLIYIEGAGFAGTDLSQLAVFNGDLNTFPCAIQSSSDSTIVCAVAESPAGTRIMTVVVAGSGFAVPANDSVNIHTTHGLAVTSLSPDQGSIYGGTVVVVAGHGFSSVVADSSILLGNGALCTLQSASASFNSIVCVTSAGSAMPVPLPITVQAQHGISVVSPNSVTFQQKSSATPVITSFSPHIAQAGDTVSFSGSLLASSRVYLSTSVLSVTFECLVDALSSSDSGFNCKLPSSLAADDYSVQVLVDGYGYALFTSTNSAVETMTVSLVIDSFTPTSGSFGGGLVISMYGSGFHTSTNFTICGTLCTTLAEDQSSSTSQRCMLQSYLSVSADGQLPTNDVSCPVVVNVASPIRMASSADLFTFAVAKTPTVASVYPLRSGTGGGVRIYIRGAGFSSTLSDNQVLIGQLPCDVITANATDLVCRTRNTTQPFNDYLTVVVASHGASSPSNRTYFVYIDVWSSPFTWGGQPPPLLGESVVIPAGRVILLDVSPPTLGFLLVEGTLIFDNVDINLDAFYILVNKMGSFQIGSETQPYRNNAVITMHGGVTTPELPIFGSKVFAVKSGTLDIHGIPYRPWTRLAVGAVPGQSSIVLQESVDWPAGYTILLTSTQHDGNLTDIVQITSVSADGFTVSFTPPLRYEHLAIQQTINGFVLRMYCEVALLSRNIVMQGSILDTPNAQLGEDQFGSQLMFHQATYIHVEYLEVRHAGQAFQLARYPVHFHMSGSQPNSYIRGCSIHDTFNRGITTHGVHNALIENNVIYNTMGHSFFVEDGIETGNRFLHNLGCLTKPSLALLNTDVTPATFWVTNPNNTYIDNVAAGSSHYGWWYNFELHPTGPSATTTVCPRSTVFGKHENNLAHSNREFGLRLWNREDGYDPRANGCNGGARLTAVFKNFTSYAAGINGVEFTKTGHIQLVNAIIADAVDFGLEWTEVNADATWGGAKFENSIVIARSDAMSTSPEKLNVSTGLGGMKTPLSSRLLVNGVTFVGFDSSIPGVRANSSVFYACSKCKPFQGAWETRFANLTFIGSVGRTSWDWEHEALYYDIDGTLSGTAGGWLMPKNGLLNPAECTFNNPIYSVNPNHPGAVCNAARKYRRFSFNNNLPSSLSGKYVRFNNTFGFTLIPWREMQLTHPSGWSATLPMNETVSFNWNLTSQTLVDPTQYSAGIYEMYPQDSIVLRHSMLQSPDHFGISSNQIANPNPVTLNDTNYRWFFNRSSLNLDYVLSGKVANMNSNSPLSFLYNFKSYNCPVTGCPLPPVPVWLQAGTRRWSSPSSWPNDTLPVAGADVVISGNWDMILDIPSTPIFKTVTILGILRFDETMDVTLQAYNIIIRNGVLRVGNATNPYTKNGKIQLYGTRSTPNYVISNSLNLASKSIGVFGALELYGAPVATQWTTLASTVSAGASTIILDVGVNWAVGAEIVIAPTNYEVVEAEKRTILAYGANNRTLILSVPLSYKHFSGVQFLPNNISISMKAEVGLLSGRSIVIEGMNTGSANQLDVEDFGARVLVGRFLWTILNGADEDTMYVGSIKIDSVEFRNAGQRSWFDYSDPRQVIAVVDNYDMSASFVKRSSCNVGFNGFIGIWNSNGMVISDNVVFQSFSSMFKVGSGSGNSFLRNLGVMCRVELIHTADIDEHFKDLSATFDIDGSNNVVKFNHAAGSERNGFRVRGDRCATADSSRLIYDNVAHTNLLGLRIEQASDELYCTAVKKHLSWKSWDYGIYSEAHTPVRLFDVIVLDAHVGISLNVELPDPRLHQLADWFEEVFGAIVVGLSINGDCSLASPANVDVNSFSQYDVLTGIMVSSFTLEMSPGPPYPWHKVKHYANILGRTSLSNITFSSFKVNACGRRDVAIRTNPLSPDAIHPTYIEKSQMLNVDAESIVYFHEPDPFWINPMDCVFMDCNGHKNSLIRDLDGSFSGTGVPTSLLPNSEIRWREDLTPFAARVNADGTVKPWNQVYTGRGITQENGACTWSSIKSAWTCPNQRYEMLVIESMDLDTETRNIAPVALIDPKTKFMNLMNSFQDWGWCMHYTCQQRLSNFHSAVLLNRTYDVFFKGTNPKSLRLHLLNSQVSDAVVLSFFYTNPQRLDVYVDGQYVTPQNTQYLSNGQQRRPQGSQYIPQPNSFAGANYFDQATRKLYVVVNGASNVVIQTASVVQVAIDLAVGAFDVFFQENVVANLAFVLQIDPSTIRIVNIVSAGQRRRDGQQTVSIQLEIGPAPAPNISVSAYTPDNSTSFGPSTGGNVTSDQPPANNTVPVITVNNSTVIDVAQQTATVDELNAVANNLVAAVQNNVLGVLLNGTVVNLVINPPQAPPSVPVALPPTGADTNVTYDQAVAVQNQDEIAVVQQTLTGGGNGNSIPLPTEISAAILPGFGSTFTAGNITFLNVPVQALVIDIHGDVISTVGTPLNPWNMSVYLYDELTGRRRALAPTDILQGTTTVEVVQGVANFSTLYLDSAYGLHYSLRFTPSQGSVSGQTLTFYALTSPANPVDDSNSAGAIVGAVVGVIGALLVVLLIVLLVKNRRAKAHRKANARDETFDEWTTAQSAREPSRATVNTDHVSVQMDEQDDTVDSPKSGRSAASPVPLLRGESSVSPNALSNQRRRLEDLTTSDRAYIELAEFVHSPALNQKLAFSAVKILESERERATSPLSFKQTPPPWVLADLQLNPNAPVWSSRCTSPAVEGEQENAEAAATFRRVTSES